MKSIERRVLFLLMAVATLMLAMSSPALARRDDGSCPGNSCNAPGQMNRLSSGSSDIKGNLKTRQHIYYEGDPLEVSIKFSRGANLLLDGTADAHVVVIAPNTQVFSVPVEGIDGASERRFFDFVVTTEALPEGQYQLGLVVTVPDGDPTNLLDWRNGFRGLLDMEGIYISAEPVPVDADGDGECDFDTDGDGFCDEQSQSDDDDDVDDDSSPPPVL